LNCPEPSPTRAPRHARLIGCLLAALATPAGAAVTADSGFVEVRFNGSEAGQASQVYTAGARVWMSWQELSALRVQLDQIPATAIDGQPYVELALIPGLQYQYLPDELRLDLQCQATCLQVTALTPNPPLQRAEESGFGSFLNYGLAYQHSADRDAWTSTAELGLFDGFGVITSSGLARRSIDGREEALRLDSSWIYDFPEQRLRSRLGDAVTRPGAWGVPLRYGGLQLGTDNSLQPYFVPFPTPDFSGIATLPSVVDVYVNNVRRQSSAVQPGPFELRQIPALSGEGEVTIVTRDALGREQTVTAPYYISQALLRPGLYEYSLEGGALRESYGRRSNDYGESFFAGTLRRGLSRSLTGELRSEWAETLRAAGLSATVLVPYAGQLSATSAISEDAAGSGHYGALGIERRARGWNAALRVEASSEGFRRLGNDVLAEAPRRGTLARIGMSRGPWGYWALAYTERQFRDRERDFRALLGTYSLPLGRRASLGVFGTLVREPEHDEFAGLTFSYSFAGGGHGVAAYTRQRDQSGAQLQYQQIPPTAGGLGYRARLSRTDQHEQADAGLTWQTPHFVASTDVARTEDSSALRAELRGAAIWFADDWYWSRPVENGFAVIDTQGVAQVPVLQDNVEIGRTDARGRLFIRDLRAYQRNRLAIDPRELPLTASVGSTETVVVPRYRSGVLVDFRVRPEGGAVLQLLRPDGTPVAAGSAVSQDGRALELPVSLDGWLFLDAAPGGSVLEVQGPDGACRVQIPAGAAPAFSGAPLPVECGLRR
jgi:outer membrane usher protein